jgi:phosphoribosylanthranilate isomerase
MKVKVCGMKDAGQISELEQAGADYCGLIFYKGSKRFLNDENKALFNQIENISILKIGVFVNEEKSRLMEVAKTYGLFAVQLHGDETPEYCREIGKNIKVIKAFRIKDGENVDDTVAPYMEAADFFLFDSGNGDYGGTGKKFNWENLKTATIGKPFFLSGGIGPDDAEAIKNFQHPFLYALDINSRFETSPGFKNLEEVRLFIKAASQIN